MRRARRGRFLPRGGVKVDVYKMVSRAVENGVISGWHRAHKHSEAPAAETIRWEIESAVMHELGDVFIWPGVEE